MSVCGEEGLSKVGCAVVGMSGGGAVVSVCGEEGL